MHTALARKWNQTLNHLRLKDTRAFHPNAQAGMTIIEILIVIALIGTIMTIVISNLMGSAENAKIDLTKVAQTNLKSALIQYKMNANQYPDNDVGLKGLLNKPENVKGWRGPYIEDEEKIRDAWGEEMSYERLSGKEYRITSAGPDNVMGNEDDITYPEPKAEEQTVSTELTIPKGQSAQ